MRRTEKNYILDYTLHYKITSLKIRRDFYQNATHSDTIARDTSDSSFKNVNAEASKYGTRTFEIFEDYTSLPRNNIAYYFRGYNFAENIAPTFLDYIG